MTVRYSLFDPGGNGTVLVSDPVDGVYWKKVAEALLRQEKTAEQVGFLRPGDREADVGLQMAGGEFCGNAALCAAAFFAGEADSAAVRVRVSGAARPVPVSLNATAGGFVGVAEMPLPKRWEKRRFFLENRGFDGILVEFEGISHILIREDMSETDAETAVKRWCRELNAPGLGLMLLEEAAAKLRPLVYIPGSDTLFWERSCASGTAAVGCALAAERRETGAKNGENVGETGAKAGGKLALKLAQSGGILGVAVEWDGEGRICRLLLENRVRRIRDGILTLAL